MGEKIKIARDFILGLFCVLFSWAWFSWGYKGGAMSDFWISREAVLIFGFFPYVMLMGSLVGVFVKMVEFVVALKIN